MYRLEDNIKIYIKEADVTGIGWIQVVKDEVVQ